MENLQHLNKLSVPTFRWLKVNDYEIKDFQLPKLKPYTNDNIGVNKEVTVIKTEMAAEELKHIDENFNYSYGVNSEFVKLGQQHFNAGVFIKIPDNTKIYEPIIIDYKINNENNVLIDNNVISIGRNSEATILIDYSTPEIGCTSEPCPIPGSTSEEATFHNGVTRVFAEEGSKIKIIKLQRLPDNGDNFDSNCAVVDRGANVEWISVELGSNVSVSNYISYLEKDESESSLDSVYLVDGSRVLDVSYTMEHKGRRSISNIKTNGVVKDKAKKIFRGTLDFKKGASRSKGSEEEYVLVLSPDARIDSIPTLLCAEDDVEGQHAASVGQINDNMLFYLMSRGLNENEAKKIIIEASFRPVLDAIPIESIREDIENELHRRIANG
jgi:Fe-S cluster assembly protein SufD